MILFPISNLAVTSANTFLVIKIVLRFSDILFLYVKVTCNDGVSHRGAISFGMVHTPAGNEDAVWVTPVRCCIVKYIEKTESGGL